MAVAPGPAMAGPCMWKVTLPDLHKRPSWVGKSPLKEGLCLVGSIAQMQLRNLSGC